MSDRYEVFTIPHKGDAWFAVLDKNSSTQCSTACPVFEWAQCTCDNLNLKHRLEQARTPKTCGNCKHWDGHTVVGTKGGNKGMASCSKIDDEEYNTPDTIACTGPSYETGSDFMTKADFGCVLFEPKETP